MASDEDELLASLLTGGGLPGVGRAGPQGGFVTNVSSGSAKGIPLAAQGGSGTVRLSINGLRDLRGMVAGTNPRVHARLDSTARDRAVQLQAIIQSELLGVYTKAGTGRFARGIHVAVVSSFDGKKSVTSLQVKALQYRENAFLTNLGNSGRFKDFPVAPYRIFARGAQSAADSLQAVSDRRTRRDYPHPGFKEGRGLAVAINSFNGISRLRVPRSSSFFTSARQVGRGRKEVLTVNDQLGPMDPSDRAGSFFFYPLWVNHPGFPADYLSDIVLREGGRYQSDIIRAVGDTIGFSGRSQEEPFKRQARGTISSRGLSVSREIPISSSTVRQTGKRDDVAANMRIFNKSVIDQISNK